MKKGWEEELKIALCRVVDSHMEVMNHINSCCKSEQVDSMYWNIILCERMVKECLKFFKRDSKKESRREAKRRRS